MIPPIILSLKWDNPKKLACVVIFKQGSATREDVEGFVKGLKKDIEEHQIFGVGRLMDEVWTRALYYDARVVQVFDESTIFMEAEI